MTARAQFASYFALYLFVSLGLSVSMTLLSNYVIKRRKNFKQITDEMRALNQKIEAFNSMFSLTQEQKNQQQFLYRYLEDCSLQLGRTYLWSRAVMFGVSFIANRVISSKFKFSLQLRLPFVLPSLLRKLLQRGQQEDLLILKLGGIAFLVNQSLRKLLAGALAVKLPKGKMPFSRLAKKIGGEDAGEVYKMLGWMGM